MRGKDPRRPWSAVTRNPRLYAHCREPTRWRDAGRRVARIPPRIEEAASSKSFNHQQTTTAANQIRPHPPLPPPSGGPRGGPEGVGELVPHLDPPGQPLRVGTQAPGPLGGMTDWD